MRIWFSIFLLAIAVSPLSSAADRPDDAAIKAVVDAIMRASDAKDLDAYQARIHPDSPVMPTLPDEIAILETYDLAFSAPAVKFVAMSGDYALYRVVQRTVRKGGPDFLDNELDGVWAFRKDGSSWKYWSQLQFELRPLARE
jgi:hypothetical protein